MRVERHGRGEASAIDEIAKGGIDHLVNRIVEMLVFQKSGGAIK